ncbi:MAG: YdeI/OmpD-associated family protein [Acidimicrobiales bacterium]
MADEQPELLVTDAGAWRAWLDANFDDPVGVWLVLAKKGAVQPTSLKYEEALEEALCYGWIDGLLHTRDDRTYSQRFTPRRRASKWSQSNVERIGRLTRQGRMQPSGLAEVERAKEDGRWEAAYPGRTKIDVPADLEAALAAEPAAQALFARLDGTNRYSVLVRLHNTKARSRPKQIERTVAMLARGETFYPLPTPPTPTPPVPPARSDNRSPQEPT